MADTNEATLSPVAPPSTAGRSRRRSIGVLVVLALAVGALLSQGLLHSLNYFVTVDEALAQKHSLGTQTLRLEGVVARGTIVRTATGTSFVMTGSGSHRVAVSVNGTPPQLFQANIPVVVVGRFASVSSLHYVGNQIMVKHSSTYIAAHPQRVKAPNGTTR